MREAADVDCSQVLFFFGSIRAWSLGSRVFRERGAPPDKGSWRGSPSILAPAGLSEPPLYRLALFEV